MQRTTDNWNVLRSMNSLPLRCPEFLLYMAAILARPVALQHLDRRRWSPECHRRRGDNVYRPRHLDGGSVYNFTTINIAAGSTLKLSGSVLPGPALFPGTGCGNSGGDD